MILQVLWKIKGEAIAASPLLLKYNSNKIESNWTLV